MISEDSVFRRVSGVNPKQLILLDGIRHAAEILDLAHTRLQSTLTEISQSIEDTIAHRKLFPMAFLDAWAIVDSIDRLRSLIKALPRREPPADQPREPGFITRTKNIRQLRNLGDHLPNRVEQMISTASPALGVLSWFTLLDPHRAEGLSCMIRPGILAASTMTEHAVNPAGKDLRLQSDLIHLSAGGYRASLSQAYWDSVEVLASIEETLQKQLAAAGVDRSGGASDLLIVLKFTGSTSLPADSSNVERDSQSVSGITDRPRL